MRIREFGFNKDFLVTQIVVSPTGETRAFVDTDIAGKDVGGDYCLMHFQSGIYQAYPGDYVFKCFINTNPDFIDSRKSKLKLYRVQDNVKLVELSLSAYMDLIADLLKTNTDLMNILSGQYTGKYNDYRNLFWTNIPKWRKISNTLLKLGYKFNEIDYIYTSVLTINYYTNDDINELVRRLEKPIEISLKDAAELLDKNPLVTSVHNENRIKFKPPLSPVLEVGDILLVTEVIRVVNVYEHTWNIGMNSLFYASSIHTEKTEVRLVKVFKVV